MQAVCLYCTTKKGNYKRNIAQIETCDARRWTNSQCVMSLVENTHKQAPASRQRTRPWRFSSSQPLGGKKRRKNELHRVNTCGSAHWPWRLFRQSSNLWIFERHFFFYSLEWSELSHQLLSCMRKIPQDVRMPQKTPVFFSPQKSGQSDWVSAATQAWISQFNVR